METVVYAPAPRGEFVELSRSPQGKLFRKQILRFGAWSHPNLPNEKLVIDQSMGETLVRNFNDGVCDIVQVPVVDGKNQHVEDPLRNLGEVIDLKMEEDGVYATIDARKPDMADELGRTLLGASAMMHMDYKDTRTGKKVGPTLLHVAITNRPYITNLKDFEQVIAASAIDVEPVVLSAVEDEEVIVTKEEMIEALREEHGIDVEELQRRAEGVQTEELVAAFSSVLTEAGITKPPADDETITIQDVAEAVIELAQEKVASDERTAALTADLERREEAARVSAVDSLIAEGKIVPAKRDAMIKLSRENPELFVELVPDAPVVDTNEIGMTASEEPDSSKFSAEVERLAEMAAQMTTGGK